MKRVPFSLRFLLLALLTPLASAVPGGTQPPAPVERRPLVTAQLMEADAERVMTAAVRSSEAGLLSGLFLTDPRTGWILYRPSAREEPQWIDFDDFQRTYPREVKTGACIAGTRTDADGSE
jgi:hypothetical protein